MTRADQFSTAQRRRRRHVMFVLLALVGVVAAANAPALLVKRSVTVEGRVTDARSGAPLEGVYVIVGFQSDRTSFMSPHGSGGCMGGGTVIRTDKEGRYHLHKNLKDVTKKPWPHYWAGDVRFYKPHWRLEPFPDGRPIWFPAETNTAFAMVPEPSFDKHLEQTQLLFENLCDRGRRGPGWVEWHAALAKTSLFQFCESEVRSFANFKRAYGSLNLSLERMPQLEEPASSDGSDEYDRLKKLENTVRALLPDYPWPYEGFHRATTTTREFSDSEHRVLCNFFRAQAGLIQGVKP